MKTKNNKPFYLFDNDGNTIDQYTILTHDGDVYGASCDPFHPQGVGSFSHNLCDKWTHLYGADWRKRLDVKKITKQEIKAFRYNARTNKEWIGKELGTQREFKKLPENLIKYIEQINI
jgi:hypothetical protein